MSIPLLDCQPAELLRACYEQTTDVGPDEIRAYLAHGPDALAQDHISWAYLVEMLLRDTVKTRGTKSDDVGIVFAYLQSISLWFGKQDFANAAALGPDSVLGMTHDGLDEVLQLLVATGRVQELTLAFDLFTQHGWNPEELLTQLQCAAFNVGEPTAFVHVIKTTLQLGTAFMVHTLWSPKHPHIWAGLWPLHVPQDYGSWERYGEAIGSIVSKIPATLPHALHCLASNSNNVTMSANAADPYFPLRLEHCEPKALVNGLGTLMEKAQPAMLGRIGELLRKHHPQLGELMAMHCTLTTGPCDNFDHLEIGLRQILGMPPLEPAMEHNIGVLFEEAH